MSSERKDFPRHYYTLDEYFALEKASDARFEYWDGQILCLSGGSRRNYRISRNVLVRLQTQLVAGRCEAFTADLPVKTPTLPPYRYPDVTVVCEEARFDQVEGIDVLVNPVLLVEVTSPSSVQRDQNEKFTAYQKLTTFSEYLLISQDEPMVTQYWRESTGKGVREDITDPHARLNLPSIGCSLAFHEIYEGVRFTAE